MQSIQTDVMSTFWKVMIALLLTLPVAAYVTGALAASRTELPGERSPVVIIDNPSTDPSTTLAPKPPTPDPTNRKTAEPDPQPQPSPAPKPPSGSEDDDDGVKVVKPTPRDVDDYGDDFDDGGEDSDDADSDDGTDDD